MSINLSKYVGKAPIFNQQGVKIGKLNDIIFAKGTGKIISYVLKISDRESVVSQLPKMEKGLIMVPFPFISFLNDKFVVFENKISEFIKENTENSI